MQKEEFLRTYAITEAQFQEAEISWEELTRIAEDYEGRLKELDQIRNSFLNEYIRNRDALTGIHSYRSRVKSTEHLIEKIIRRRTDNYLKYRTLNETNYMKFVTDVIGFRALLLYREDWVIFHRYLIEKFENTPELYIRDCLRDFKEDRDRYMAEAPKVHMRPGDFGDIYADWISSDNIYDQKYYRSVHYILKYRGVYLEVQVRTLFEEGWGEIDHHILYPYRTNDPMLTEFSELLNRLAGMGDEMASFFRRLQDVPSDRFPGKKSTVDVRSNHRQADERAEQAEGKKIETAEDAIRTVLMR